MNKWGNITIGVLDQWQLAVAQQFCGGFSSCPRTIELPKGSTTRKVPRMATLLFYANYVVRPIFATEVKDV
jgi:hypothetical protein